MVLNSLADDKFQASIRCVAQHGKFLEIGKYDLIMDSKIGSKIFLKNITFYGVFLDQLFDDTATAVRDRMITRQLLFDGIKTGSVKPLPCTVFGLEDVEKAFRFMGAGTHIGKVLIEIRKEETQKIIIPKPLKLIVEPATYFFGHKVYIIVGGLGGFGLEVAKWILAKGARNIVLTSRYGARTPYHHLCLKRWRDKGNNVVISTRNVSIKEEAYMLLKEMSDVKPIGGIFNSALVLHDAFLENMNLENFNSVCAPKADATIHLDNLSRSMCPELDHFVCFSSISCGKGNAGQMNYGYANSVMERVCEQRIVDGLPGLSIQWGIIGEVGVVHRQVGDDAMIAGVGAQRVKSCLEVLDLTSQMQHPVVCSYVIKDLSLKVGDPKDILQQLARMFGLKDPSEFNSLRSFGEMGVDSMIGVEMKLLLENTFNTTFTATEIQEMKIDDIKALVEKAQSGEKGSLSNKMISTTHISLPKSFNNDEFMVPLNKTEGIDSVFILDFSRNSLSELHLLGKYIDLPAYAILWSKEITVNDVESVAAWCLEKLRHATYQHSHLIALSSTSIFALEIMLQIGKSDILVKSFTTINGSSSLVKAISRVTGDQTSESDILCDFVENYIPGVRNEFKEQISKATNLEQQVGIVVDLFSKTSTETVNKDELIEVVTMHVKRAFALENYRPKSKLNTEILVIEDSTKVLANDVAELKMTLSQICSGKIKIERIPGIQNFTEKTVSTIVPLLNFK